MVTILCNIPDVFLLFLSHVSEVSKDNETREDTCDAVDWSCNETIPANIPRKVYSISLKCNVLHPTNLIYHSVDLNTKEVKFVCLHVCCLQNFDFHSSGLHSYVIFFQLKKKKKHARKKNFFKLQTQMFMLFLASLDTCSNCY